MFLRLSVNTAGGGGQAKEDRASQAKKCCHVSLCQWNNNNFTKRGMSKMAALRTEVSPKEAT